MKTSQIAALVQGELRGSEDVEVNSVAAIGKAEPGQIAFYEGRDTLPATRASCVLVSRPFHFDGVLIIVSDPKLAFARSAQKLIPNTRKYAGSRDIENPTGIFAASAEVLTADIGRFVTVGENSQINEACQIGDGTRIGNNVLIHKGTIVHQNCVIYDNVEIGRGCVIHAGAVIGADGFGYVRDGANGYIKFPQIGRVVIEDNVEIGANTCIDRGALGETRIGEGTKIDNLVQVGHNVNIGKRCVIAAQTGISGSVTIEDDCVIGGQVGFGDHVRVQSGAIIGSQAGILPGKIVRPGVWWGTPIQPLDEYKRQNAHVKGLARLKDDVKMIKKHLPNLRGAGGEPLE